MGRLRQGRPGAVGAAAQEQPQPQNRREQRREDRQQFGIGGSAERGYFFAMEYLDGVDLRALVQHGRGPLPLEHALWVAMGVAAGLHYAHERVDATGKAMGIIHRDVSLSNVFVTRDGAVKLLDFGIAKAASRVAQTRPGSIRGKLSYMSPEQCQGEELDRRTDLFSLGIVMYELTLGEPLFSGKNDAIVLDKVLNQRIVPPSERSHGFPSELDRIIMRALERDVGRQPGGRIDHGGDPFDECRIQRHDDSHRGSTRRLVHSRHIP